MTRPTPEDPPKYARMLGLRREAVQRVLDDVFPGATFDQADEVISGLERQGYEVDL